MNCPQTKELLPAYLDNEINPSERRLIQAHLAGCNACQRDLALLSQTRKLVSQSLNIRAADAVPSPQALSRLQAKLADEALRPHLRLITWFKRSAPFASRAQSTLQGKLTMKTKFAFSALAALLVLAATVAFVPPVRAQVSEWFTITFHDPNNSDVSFGGSGDQPKTYQVMQPGYLPQVFSDGTTHTFFGEPTEVIYKADDKFLVITQMAAADSETLPDGETVTVNGQPAVLNKGLSGSYQESSLGVGTITLPVGTVSDPGNGNGGSIAIDQTTAIDPITFDYTDAAKLTFMIGNTKIEMLSNLSIDEILKIAAELVLAK